MKVSDYVVSFLKESGVKQVFEMSGGTITHLLDSLNKDGTIRVVSVHHEQAAAFASDAVGRITGIPGVAMATSGPGATNLLTGIGSCYFDSSPAVFITGQVNRNEQKKKLGIRQLGFQETDIVSMAIPITKASWQAQTPEEVPDLLSKAFALSTEGRPGPVLIDLPMDVQRSDIPISEVRKNNLKNNNIPLDIPFLEDMLVQLRNAKRPLILIGGGIRSALAIDLFRTFIERIPIPVVYSLMAKDVLPHSNPLRVGLIGSYGNRWANLAIGRSDLLLVLGSRLDTRQTGSQINEFRGDRKIFHVDCEKGEINNRIQGCSAVVADLREFLMSVLEINNGIQFKEHSEWLDEINDLRKSWPDTLELSGISGINPNVFMHKLSTASLQAAVYSVDVGQHQMWAAQSLEIGSNQRFITSGGMGSMGFGLPAGIGASIVVAPKPVVVIAGDGGFQANIQELQTVVRNKLPIKIVIINNHCHGMVRQFQESYFDQRYQSTLWGYSFPDFSVIASAYGIPNMTIQDDEEINNAMKWLWENPNEPALLQVHINTFANAYPKIAFGSSITEMEHFNKST